MTDSRPSLSARLIVDAWRNMQRLKEDGVARHVGVSNFYPQHLDVLKEAGEPAPYADEVFIDAVQQEEGFVTELAARGIRAIGYRALALRREPKVFEEVAAELGVGVRGLVLGWMLRRGVVPLFRSGSEEHIAANVADAKKALAALDDGHLRRLAQGEYKGPVVERLSHLCRTHGQAVEISQ